MPTLMWDASALAKRYVKELGSETVNALFSLAGASKLIFTLPGYGEAYSILCRRHNGGQLSASDFASALTSLQEEVLESPNFEILKIEALIVGSLPLVRKHNLNSTDAAILAAYLGIDRSPSADGLPSILVASDHRLLRAALAEKLPVLDPEAIVPSDIPGILNSL